MSQRERNSSAASEKPASNLDRARVPLPVPPAATPEPARSRRGRPPKAAVPTVTPEMPKRKRGRPRLTPKTVPAGQAAPLPEEPKRNGPRLRAAFLRALREEAVRKRQAAGKAVIPRGKTVSGRGAHGQDATPDPPQLPSRPADGAGRRESARHEGGIEAYLEWPAAMCSHIPNRGEQMVRYCGYYSNASRGKRKEAGTDDALPCILDVPADERTLRKNWARLIHKIKGSSYPTRSSKASVGPIRTRFTCDLCPPCEHIMLLFTVNQGMPHLSKDWASGAASSTVRRGSSGIARRWEGCFAKNPSIGDPEVRAPRCRLRPRDLLRGLLHRCFPLLARRHHNPAFRSRSMKDSFFACAWRSASMRSPKSLPLPRAARSRRSTRSFTPWS